MQGPTRLQGQPIWFGLYSYMILYYYNILPYETANQQDILKAGYMFGLIHLTLVKTEGQCSQSTPL